MLVHRIRCAAAGVAVAVVVGLGVLPQSAAAQFSITKATASVTGIDGTFSRQAGAHADLRTRIAFAQKPGPTDTSGGAVQPGPVPDGSVRDINVDLPAGVTGNPTAAPTCTPAELVGAYGGLANCPVNAQVGVAVVQIGFKDSDVQRIAVYNIETPPDLPALFAMNYLGAVVRIEARVRPGDYGISALSPRIPEAIPIYSIDLTLWGVPADPSHDGDRFTWYGGYPTPSTAPRLPFMTNPTSCPDAPATTTISADSWQAPGVFSTVALDADPDGTPFVTEGCDRLAFDPSISVQPLSHRADAPTGLDVDVKVPQSDAPDGLATAHVRRTVVTLPQGMSVSPSSAAGLGACSLAEIGLGTDAAPTCPASSKIGTVKIDTPLLTAPLEGDVILARQDDNPFRSLLALYLVAKGPGFIVKLPGRVDPDPVTGQLTATFDNTPQLPFSRLRVTFDGGSRAPLATPPTCGTYTSHAEISSWASATPVSLDTPMTIDQGCDAPGFAPSFSAGSANPLAGRDSPFSLTLTRADRTPYLARIDTVLPAGLLARIASAARCDAGPAATGACPQASLIGQTSVLAGPGPDPLPLSGQVYLTGPYRDAPFGLSIVVPTAGQTGPFDLGNVVVRAGIYVDRTTARVTIKSDPLPTIIRGFPLRLRRVNVTIDRPGFMFNPTSCAPATVAGAFAAVGGATSLQTSRFQVGGCSDLALDQRLALQFTGKRATTDGQHPGLQATLTSKGGGANLRTAVVKLPLSVALDPDNAEVLCSPEQRAALACPKASIIGSAKAVSVLPHPLTGPVYFVQGTRVNKRGRTVKTLPKLWIPLSADGVTIDVNADSGVDSLGRLVTTFRDLPDAPFSEFALRLNGGKHGIIVVSGKPGTCDRDKTIDSQFAGQNGKLVETATKAMVQGCKSKVIKASSTSRSVTLRVNNLTAGKLTLSGALIKRATRTITQAAPASVTARLSTKARTALRHHARVKVRVSVHFQPKTGKAVKVTHTVTVKR